MIDICQEKEITEKLLISNCECIINFMRRYKYGRSCMILAEIRSVVSLFSWLLCLFCQSPGRIFFIVWGSE